MEERPLSTLVREILVSFSTLMRSEVRLVKAEIMQSLKRLIQTSSRVLIFGAIIYFGIFALLAAAVIGLGNLIDGRYGLSALLIGVVLVVPSSVFAIGATRHILDTQAIEDVARNFKRDREVLTDKIQNVSRDLRGELPKRKQRAS